MKKVLLLSLLSIFLVSCGTTSKLKGNYPSPNQYTETSLSYDEVWSKIIDFFAINGIPISTIDKTSGLIVASSISFVDNYTREDSHGYMINPNAFVVIPTVRSNFGLVLEPTAATKNSEWTLSGDWNVRIKSTGDKTLINVNLLNLRCSNSIVGLYNSRSTSRIPIKSTGVFEKTLLDMLK